MINLPDHELAPEIDRCPCCGLMVCDRHPVTGARERRNVRAQSAQNHDDQDRLIGVRLIWACEACNCWWVHGQFMEPDIDLSACQECGEFRTHGHVCKEVR